MFHKFNLFLVFVIVILANSSAFSQVTANFSASPLQGCEPLVVNFTNTSTGTGTLTYSWAFGNGNTSVLQNPSANYISAGVYSVTLTVSNGTSTDTKVIPNYITVFAKPTTNFSGDAPLSGCIPLSISFNDLSTQGDGAITNWQWDFGDGNSSTLQNPTHSYSSVGIYAVSLQVTDEHGCTDDFTIQNYDTASTKPNLAFSASSVSSCAVPFTVNFTNTSTGFGNLTYQWNFGDGGTSNSTSPAHTYTVAGTYAVTLIGTDQYGCSDTLVMPDSIRITPIDPLFHVTPNPVCVGQVVNFFNDAGTGSWWTFGDGTNSGIVNPTHSYGAPGSYLVTFFAAPGTVCQSYDTISIIVRQPPQASFNASSHYYCGGSPITFTDTSPDAVSWQWSLGDGNTSTLQNPSASYTNEGAYTASVTITDSYGCIGTYTDPTQIVVDFPSASIAQDGLQNHCVPYADTLTGTGICNTTYDNITGYQWDFGDGTNSNTQNPVHVYTTPGEYTISLTVTTATGCTATSTATIKVGSHQIPIIDYSYTGGCANDSNIHFISLSTDSNLIDFWDWTFIANFPDSNFTVATSSEQHPTVDFDGIDSITIQYIIGYLECKDTLYDTNAFFLNGPFIDGMLPVFSSCSTPYEWGITFDFVKKATRYYWDFDSNGTYDDSSKFSYPAYIYSDTIWHTFPGRGHYWVHLYAFNDSSGCKYDDSVQVWVLDIHADITAPSPHCVNNNLFDISGSLDWDNTSAPSASFDIDYGDGQTIHYSTFSPFIPHNFPTASGSYWVNLNMQNFLGCRDTDSVFIRIFNPVAGYTMSPDTGCAPLLVTFMDTSYSDTTFTSTWFPGITGSATGDSVTFTYTNTGVFSPSLLIVDAIGCTSSVSGTSVNVIDLYPSFGIVDSTICLGDSVHFTSQATNAVLYEWNFGDLSPINNTINPSYLYADTGMYTISLIVHSLYPGCIDTVTNQHISVQTIDAQFSTADSSNDCYPFAVVITNLTDTVFHPAWNWNFGDGGVGIQYTPFHNYTIPGNFLLTLQATTPNGCTDMDTVPITITGPYANILVSDSVICKGDTVTFTLLNASGIGGCSWDFGDGGVSNDTSTVIVHVYNTVPPSGGYGPSLIYWSPNGGCQLSNYSDSVYVKQVMASFNYTQALTGATITGMCQPGSIDFYNTSLGPDSSVWSLGDGQTFSVFEPNTNTYYDTTHAPITYDIWLTVYNNSAGCIDSVMHQFTVYPQPRLNLSNDTAICRNTSAYLLATGDANSIMWSPAQWLSNPTSFSPSAIPDSTIMYTAYVSDINGCTNEDSLVVFVQQKPTVSIVPSFYNLYPDTTIIIGEVANIVATPNQNNVSYLWSPPTGLSCLDCYNPTAQPFSDITYFLVISDSMHCFEVTDSVRIIVKEEYSLDVPSAFTPNGDNENDIVFAKGWGIKYLLEFKIYNRWGECIFSTDDINQGWDGKFKGIKQNIDTYAYTARAVTWSGKVLTKNGLINLMR